MKRNLLMALVGALLLPGCMPVHSYEESYEMPGYTPQELKARMESTLRIVIPPSPEDVTVSEVPVYLSEQHQAMSIVTADSARGTLLTLRMVMWEKGYEITPDSGRRLFEQVVVQPLRAHKQAQADSAAAPAPAAVQ